MTLLRSIFLTGCFATLAVAVIPPASAQQARAYAPENLKTLSIPDRTRVIRQEYGEQARGRQIPDDQLRFYLDQVQLSNWTFSQIKSDIATSLGGGNWRPPGPNPGTGDNIRCESNDGRSRVCNTPWRGNSRLVKQLSSARCTEGTSWFSSPGKITVSNGCRAEFAQRAQIQPPISSNVRCESNNGQLNACPTPWQGPSRLARQLSRTTCIEGRNWQSRNRQVQVWAGCSGEFIQGAQILPPTQPTYSVTCSSDKGRYTTCAWDARRGQPYLLQTLSSNACVQGRTWGYAARTGLWVDKGCRARFGAR